MTFSEFAKKIASVLKGKANQADFVEILFSNIIPEDKYYLVEELSESTWKGYYQGNSINEIARSIVTDTDPVLFEEYINHQGSAAEKLCDVFRDDIPGINVRNAGILIGELFEQIIREAADESEKVKFVNDKEIKTVSADDAYYDRQNDGYTLVTQRKVESSKDPSLENKITVYLKRGYDKYSLVKTLFFGDKLVNFYDIYVCGDLEGTSIYTPSDLGPNEVPEDVVRNARLEDLEKIHNCIIISGMGGEGKSMMMRHLFLTTAKEYEKGCKVPVFLTIRNYEDEYASFEDYLFSAFDAFGNGFTRDDMLQLLISGRCMLLFDGMDEISGKRLVDFQKNLAKLTDRYPGNQYVVSSRPMRSYSVLDRFQVLDLLPFSKDQALELVQKLNFRPDAPEIKEKFLQKLDTEYYDELQEFAQNPLLLTIMLMTFIEYGNVPAKRYLFYEEAFATLAKKHDASKGAFVRPLRTGVSVNELKSYFAEFCARTYHDKCYNFNETSFARYCTSIMVGDKPLTEILSVDDLLYDLNINLCLLYYESGKYHFIHRSFQEYFCALFFSWQMDSALEGIADLFDIDILEANQDETLSMLYAMIPERMELFCFLPYLRKKLTYYENNEGYWSFLSDMYPRISYRITDVPGRSLDNVPSSFLYSFTRRLFMKDDLMHLQLPYADEFILYDVYLRNPNCKNGAIFIDKGTDPLKIWKDDDPVFIGHAFSFSVQDIVRARTRYSSFIDALQSKDCALFREYEAIEDYCKELENRLNKPRKNLFDSMIRRTY